MRKWLLILLLMPLAAGQTAVVASMGFEVSLPIDQFEYVGGPLDDDSSTCEAKAPEQHAASITFSEAETELGCGYVAYDAAMRSGATLASIHFELDRNVSPGDVSAPSFFVQQLVVDDGDRVVLDLFEPRAGSQPPELFEYPLETLNDNFRLHWLFVDQGARPLGAGIPIGAPGAIAHQTTLQNIAIRYHGFPADIRETTAIKSILDQRIDTLTLALEIPNNETGQPFLDLIVEDKWFLDNSLSPAGKQFVLTETGASILDGTRQFHLGTEITEQGGGGKYVLNFRSIAHTQQDAYLGPIAVMAFVFPMAGILFSYREYRHTRHRVGDDPVINSGMAWLWRATVTVIVAAISWVLLSGRFVGMLYWPPNVEDVLYYSILISTGSFMFLYMFLWRRQTLMVDLDKEIQRRRQTQDTLEQSNRDLEMFAYVASHDMKQPLRMVKFYTRRLKEKYGDQLDDDARDYIDFAADNAERMEALVQGLLDYSRVDAAQYLPDNLSMGDILEGTKSNLQLLLDEAGGNLTWDDLGQVQGNFTQLSQLLQNLVENSIKYRGKAAPVIHVTREAQTFRVTDNGVGISPKDQGRVFKLFKQLDVDHDGEGIGLALCRRIVEKHGGTIQAKSNPAGGTIIEFTLK